MFPTTPTPTPGPVLTPDALPPAALKAVHDSLRRDGEDPDRWTAAYVWQNSQDPAGYAVVMRWDKEVRGFTVVPEGGGFEAWGVTE